MAAAVMGRLLRLQRGSPSFFFLRNGLRCSTSARGVQAPQQAASATALKLYLAGPDCFRTDAAEQYQRLKAMASAYGFEGVSPLDNEADVEKEGAPEAIFRANIELIDRCDVVVANVNPFRGCCVDDGTSFEIGAAFVKGKRIVCYMESANIPMKIRVARDFGHYGDFLEAMRFPHLEDFPGNTNPVNLMIAQAAKGAGGGVFTSFEQCLQFLAKDAK
eukprot:TRINITY_DN40884_c0_g1_i1.p1 TRINITY_DN40884_c0_g1~~TRINITY_DN40884_c0_g1_i1.p1  ORF type:complete len:233 (+),score=50.07 TRINITY_DN40884_c0_g1_i1:46-699(+)